MDIIAYVKCVEIKRIKENKNASNLSKMRKDDG